MNIKTQRGFIGLGAIIAIVLGLIIVGGGAYYLGHQNSAPQTQENYPDLSTTQQTQPTTHTTVQANTNTTATTPTPAPKTQNGTQTNVPSATINLNATVWSSFAKADYPVLAGTLSGTNRICIVLSQSNLPQTYSAVAGAQWNICSDSDTSQIAITQNNWTFQSYNPATYPQTGSLPTLANGAYNVGIYNEVSGNLLASSQAVYWGMQIVNGADASSFHVVANSNEMFYADATHVWYGAGRGVLVQIKDANAKTFTIITNSCAPNALTATDGTHYYSFDAQDNLQIGTSKPYCG